MKEESNRSFREEKVEPADITTASPFLRWFDNFWYYHKWKVIVISFFVVILTIGIVQIVTRPKYDTFVVYAASKRLDKEERAALTELLSKTCPSDMDGNGEKSVYLRDYLIYSPSEYEEEKKYYESLGERYEFNKAYNQKQFETLSNYVMTGECSVYILSPYVYADLKENGRLRPIAGLYEDGRLPKGIREDGYGINLSETDFYRYHKAAQVLPENAILCVMASTVWGGGSDEKIYGDALAMYHAIADYRVKDADDPTA